MCIRDIISAMSLLLQKGGENTREMGEQLFKIEQYVDLAMNYARLDSPSNDFVIRRCSLDSVARQAIKKYAPLFIGKGIRVDFRETGLSVLSDEKWLCFSIEQIISNAIKYTPSGGSVTIWSPGDVELCISDTGAGIAPEDLPRIWERGYTGINGREDKRASGIGLYLTRMILTRLGHTVRAESVLGQGTTFTLGLESREIIAE